MKILIFISILLVSTKAFSQVPHVETRLEIDLKKHLSLGGPNDSLQFYPTAKEIAGTLRSTEFINDCLTRTQKQLKSVEKKALMNRLKGTLSEDEKYLDISFTDVDIKFAKQFMDTVVWHLQMKLIEDVYRKFREREEYLNAQLDVAIDMQRSYEGVYLTWVDEKRLHNYETQRYLLQEKWRHLDSLQSIDKHAIEGLHALENRFLKGDQIYGNMPGIYIGFHDYDLHNLYKTASALQKDTSKKVEFEKIKTEILVYIKDFEKSLTDRSKIRQKDLTETEYSVNKLLKLEGEYRKMRERRTKYEKRVENFEDQLYNLKIKRSGIVPVIRLVEVPSIVE